MKMGRAGPPLSHAAGRRQASLGTPVPRTPTSFSHIDLCLVTFPSPLLQLLQSYYCYFCHRYRYFHTTLLLNTLLQILSFPGVVELTTQLLILENILWLPLCRINKFGLNI